MVFLSTRCILLPTLLTRRIFFFKKSQIRLGNTQATRGTAYVVYESPNDAKAAHDGLGGFNFQGRYLVLLFHSVAKMNRSLDELETRKANLEKLKEDHGIE